MVLIISLFCLQLKRILYLFIINKNKEPYNLSNCHWLCGKDMQNPIKANCNHLNKGQKGGKTKRQGQLTPWMSFIYNCTWSIFVHVKCMLVNCLVQLALNQPNFKWKSSAEVQEYDGDLLILTMTSWIKYNDDFLTQIRLTNTTFCDGSGV